MSILDFDLSKDVLLLLLQKLKSLGLLLLS